MALVLRVPALGESVREATLGAWKRAEGDEVTADEPLVEVESEKATLEVPSPGAGVLRKILRKAGDTVAVGEAIAEIEQLPVQTAAGPSPAKAASNGRQTGAREEVKDGGKARAAEAPARESAGETTLRAAPSARRALAESGLPAD
jgi:2-oxoglutarate dehydrogenase E2 component (dihydrolipoamide succinyltransferase)